MSLEGVVTKSTGSWYNVRMDDGSIISSRIRGKFRIEGLKLTNPVAVGDIVRISVEESGQGWITDILPRKKLCSKAISKEKTPSTFLSIQY